MYNTLWDPNDDKERLFEKFNRYYGEFSDDVREDMQSRNVQVPTSVYDVLYPESREKLLSKNVPKTTDILEDTEPYRQAALAKIVPVITDIEEMAETYRITQLSKNVVEESSVLEISKRHRLEQLAKNEPIGTEPHLRKSKDFREQMQSKNVPNPSDLEKDTQDYRDGQLSKNVPNVSDIEEDTQDYRDQQLSKNVPNVSDIEEDTQAYRDAQLSNNVPNTSDIEKDTQDYRDGQLSKNVPNVSDIEKDTQDYRDGQLSKNVPNVSDIEQDTQAYRDAQLGNNVPNPSDIEQDTQAYRDAQLGNNVPSESDLESDSAVYRDNQLSNTVPSSSDIEQDTQAYRDAQLGNNVPSESDLERDSEVYRDNQIGNTVPSESDLERDSEVYRDNQLGNTVPSESDLERDSVPYREGDLGNNVPSESDLESDSVSYRDSNLSNNVPSESDLETDSVPFRESDLSNNVPSESDLETDSVPFRESDLSNNVPSESDLETDSIPFRESDLSNNVPSTSDLETDSVPFREDDLSNNVPSESNLLEDSIPFRLDDLSNNVPSESDLFVDSLPYRTDDLSNNVPSDSDLLLDTEEFRQSQLSNNVGFVSDILEDTEPYRQEQLSNNVPAFSNILSDTEQARKEQLSKNLQGGLFGVNIEGFGTQAFVGVSRNFAFGILVREALLARNEYKPGFLFSEGNQYSQSTDGRIEDSVFVSDDGVSTARSKIEAMHLRNGQTSLGYRNWVQAGDTGVSTPEIDGSVTDVARAFKKNTINNIGDEPTADDLLAKSVVGNPLENTEFATGPKSIKSVIDKIANESTVPYAKNYQVGQREFIVDSTSRTRKQRYSVSNLYAPAEAGELMFSITNYAIENLAGRQAQLKTMYFPPYIQSFQESEEANWNETNMLGRPEAIYTYNNARRSGSINFYVLTDFAQEVELGLTETPSASDLFDSFAVGGGDPVMGTLKYDFEKEGIFTELSDDEMEMIKDVQQDVATQADLEKLIIKDHQDLADLEASYDVPIGPILADEDQQEGLNPLRERIKANKSELNRLSKSIEEKRLTAGKDIEGNTVERTRFSENYKGGGNIYHPGNLLDYPKNPTAEDNITSIKNVESVLDDMKKNLGFQPAFFSGDKVDFRRRMSFLSKLTRPSENSGRAKKVGFSFVAPPVAHLKLGDWLDHDCIINSINKDYSDTVWCLQRGKVQPLWAAVTVSFTIIGPYGTYSDDNDYRPLTASDAGGYYSQRRVW